MPPSQREPDAEEEDRSQYSNGTLTIEELNVKYPDRPHNKHKTFYYRELVLSLFNPLNENKKRPTGPKVSRRKQGPHVASNSPHEIRRAIIERFISKWREEVGNDFYPALRLIVPEKDRDRAMYGLKEKAIGRLLVKLLKIDKNSEDGFNLLNWKLPGQSTVTQMAGDFAGRCGAVLTRRQMRQDPGDMRIAEVNVLLDQLSKAQKEEHQLPIFEKFYNRMNGEELQWLIRIILRQMKLGATEKTVLNLWHPNGEALFSVSSSLRRVCWELADPDKRLGGDETGVELMSCFQPQLAQFQMHSLEKMVDKLGMPLENPEFWIEEKLDGERMQLHMMEDDNIPGGKQFAFWSRKAKDYTYLYGNGFEDENSALTRHIRDAFDPRTRNIILDGEMITWEPDTDKMVPFGTLKSAALSEQKNPYQISGIRPLFRVFDCLYLNNMNITKYTLRDRRKALESAVKNVHRRLEKHHFQLARTAKEIEPALRQIVAESSEGLVLKNPNSIYQLNSRVDDWMKVKPDYMLEFGESLDCVIIGGYYGSGHRGGGLSSFLCGLRVDQNHVAAGANPMKCFSFFKVGGGFRVEDYAAIKHHTEGKWTDWDRNHPPTEFVELAGKERQYERPDVWIKPCDSVVVEVKAAEVTPSDSFKTSYTLRFPRFKRLRLDKNWESALSLSEFSTLRAKIEQSAQKDFKVESKRKVTKRLKKELTIAGNESQIKNPYGGPDTAIFKGLNFFVVTDMLSPVRKSKAELEQIIKANGGSISQSATAKENIICIGDKRVVKVASLIKMGNTDIPKGKWILDVVHQAEIDGPSRESIVLPYEPSHMFFMTDGSKANIEANVDLYGDSYMRDAKLEELAKTLDDMIIPKDKDFSASLFLSELGEHDHGLRDMVGFMFARCVVRFVPSDVDGVDLFILQHQFLFCSGMIAKNDDDETITHFVTMKEDQEVLSSLRMEISSRRRIPRIVRVDWLKDCWAEKTLLDEERYIV